MTDYENMTVAELEAENLRLSESREQILQEQISLNDILNMKIAEQNAQDAIEQMTDEQRTAFENALKG
ncbi:hypothetical protein [uncultured Methanobacterium sp.]|uniref:hypothetical protein n=1 Tax=uncultured Methanobacterium sp. TaxID=176306 RepID=UPI002AA7A31E|nr:hypothetical protein [uncultured Methanobacterium sp.]